MGKSRIKWTGQQARAIKARGSDVLVTASAGTGKTAVLSGRCVDIVSDKSMCPDVLSILVLTFTEKAAEEMRSRIAGQLKDAYLESSDKNLRRQLMLLAGADISTIHSFCKRLITEYFYKLGLDPSFGIIDEDEQKLIQADVLEKTIDWAWQQEDMRQGLEELFYRRDLRINEGFASKIIQLSGFLDSVVQRDRWYERAILLAQACGEEESSLGEKQKRIIAKKLAEILNRLKHAQRIYEDNVQAGQWTVKCQEKFIEPVEQCIEFSNAAQWEKCSAFIRDFKKPMVNKPKDAPKAIAELIQKAVKRAMELFRGLSSQASLNPDYLEKVGVSAGLQTKVMIELVRKFDEYYSQSKRKINCLDFHDLEHYALKLLSEAGDSEEQLNPSETALSLRRKYRYIFVDEYQDINPVQQNILDLLKSGDNVFEVGDVKQSIYAFRGAEPKIFLEHIKSASTDLKNPANGLRVDLNSNWRSDSGILDFVNRVFGRIMISPLANVDYDESAKLRPGTQDSDKQKTEIQKNVVELHILDESSEAVETDQDEQSEETGDVRFCDTVTSTERQAAMIAKRIKEIVGADTGKAEFQIYDKAQDEYRDVEYRDIVILMRSPSKRVNEYAEVLRLASVPVSCERAGGYFEKTEISDCMSLLKVLDNPQRDIELAAILRSWFFNISDSQLAKIKLHGRKEPKCRNFYDCVLSYSQAGKDKTLAEKLTKVLKQLSQWRQLGRRGHIADLIWQFLQQSGYLWFVSALSNGSSRRANLLKLHDRAIQFEGFASSGPTASLRRFVEFIEKTEQAGADWDNAEPQAEAENAVRIMSVHKSKGLEFSVVFLAELENVFNTRDITNDCLAETEDALGLQIIDRTTNSKVSSLAHQVISEAKGSTNLAEEMRILYVAMTRARERLILSGSIKGGKCRDIIRLGYTAGSKSLPAWLLRDCKSHLEWILCGLSDQKILHESFETETAGPFSQQQLFSIKVYGQGELEGLGNDINRLRNNKTKRSFMGARKIKAKPKTSKLFELVKKSLSWSYSFAELWRIAAKQSVTQMTNQNDEYAHLDFSKALERRPKAVSSAESAKSVDSRLIGTATHLLISRLDLTGKITQEAIEEVKEKLIKEGAIVESVAEHIDTNSIMRFFQSDLGQKVIEPANKVRREWPFSIGIPASQISNTEDLEISSGDDDIVIVQGIVDMVVETVDGLLVIDFKTDHISSGQVSERGEFYRGQLELYGQAAENILGADTVRKCLWFLGPGCAYEI